MRGASKAIAGACAAAVLAAGCGSSSPKQPPSVSLRRAADVSSAATGYKAVVDVRETVPGAGQVTVSGTGQFNLVPKRNGSMTMQLNVPAGASAGLSNLRMQAVFVPGTIYMKLPPQLANRIPGGKPWLLINLAQLGKAAGIPGLSSLLNGSASVSNPGQYVQYLRATASGSVKDLGQATINGLNTTHYHAIVDLTKVANVAPASSRPAIQQLVAQLRSHGASTQIPIDAWIDSANLIRRVALTYGLPVNGQQLKVALEVTFTEYGPQPAPTVPPASQTTNLLAALGRQP